MKRIAMQWWSCFFVYWQKFLKGIFLCDRVTSLTPLWSVSIDFIRELLGGEMKLPVHQRSDSSLDLQTCISGGCEHLEFNAQTALSIYTTSICSCWTSAICESAPQHLLKSFSTEVAHRKSMHLSQKKAHKRVSASWSALASRRSAVCFKQVLPLQATE